MKKTIAWPFFGFIISFLFSTTSVAQLQATPASVDLTRSFCPTPLDPPAANPGLWSGEHKRWTSGPMRPLIKVTLNQPKAICNDGSQAVMYVRRAPASVIGGGDNPYSDTYHIHFKGGGSCRTFEECAMRWCNLTGKTPDKPGQMSSRGYYDAIEGEGIFADRPRNKFALSNQVLLGYCSSDGWIGSALPEEPISNDPNDDPARVTRIAFMGEHITKAALRTLDGGVVATAPVEGAPSYTMPPLTVANRILISGDSAGAGGARAYLDEISAKYSDADVIAMLDAGASVDMQDPRLTYPAGITYESMMQDRTAQAKTFHGVDDTALDRSCKAANPVSVTDDYVCFDNYVLQKDYISTPTLQRTSYRDVTVTKRLVPAMVGTKQDVSVIAHDGLDAAQSARANLSVLGPNCAQHVTFRNNKQISEMEVVRGGRILYRDLWNWVSACFSGACPKAVKLASPLQPPAGPSPSVCP